MLVTYVVNHQTKTVKIKKDKLNGTRFSIELASEIFSIEDKGYIVECGSNAVEKKFNNFKVACWRNSK